MTIRLGKKTIDIEGLDQFQVLSNSFANIVMNSSGTERIQTIAVSSSVHGEGSSTIAANFAVSLATSSRILLIDANLRRPALHDIFSLERGPGLSELILREEDFNNLIRESQFNNLFVLTGGMAVSRPREIYESQRFDDFLRKWKKSYDYIFFDSCPISSCPEFFALAPKVGNIVLVIEAERTRAHVVESVKIQLERAKVNILGIVLNKKKLYVPNFINKRL